MVEVLSFPELLCKQITAPWVEAGMIHFLGVCCFSLSLLKVVGFFLLVSFPLKIPRLKSVSMKVMIDGSFSKGKDMIETEATDRTATNRSLVSRNKFTSPVWAVWIA